MFDKIIKTLFVKKISPKKKSSTLIIRDRKIKVQDNLSASCLAKEKSDEIKQTCLTEYFKHNKGLNYIERNTRLCVATID